ncbi:MAG: ABC transporter permease [Bacteroidetes bacterium]|nr:ABC transporter permease [Bacteroidota bacterium]
MLANYLKIALRNLRRHPAYTFINVTGLAVGMACCLLILLFVRDELSYDRHHDNADRIYRIVSDWGNFSLPSTNPPVINRLGPDFPEVTIALLRSFDAQVRYEDLNFHEERLYFANPEVFEVFDIPVVRGNPETMLAEPGKVALTEETARKYFGNDDPVGKMLNINNQFEAEVVGIVEAMPEHSHFHFDFLVPWATLDVMMDFSNSMSWGNNSYYTYLMFPEGYAPETLEAQFPAFIERHAGDNWNGAELSLQALTDIHLHSHHNMELEANSNVAYIYIFSIIAVFILLVACINFMNLATARSAERAKEVGVRKVVGARRGQLVQQFLAESILLAGLALVLAMILTAAALPAFRALSGKGLTLSVLDDGFTLLAFFGIALLVGILSGSYPAFVLSSFRPVAVLKSGYQGRGRGAFLRKGLVVFQFAISICLIVGTMVVYTQLSYLREASLGFDKEQVVVVPLQRGTDTGLYPTFKDALLQRPDVLNVTIASEGLPSELLNGNGTRLAGVRPDDPDASVATRTVSIGHDFFETLGVGMQAGRSFSLDFPADSGAFILNATAAQLLQETFPEQIATVEEAVGQTLRLGNRTGPLVGIAEDFNLSSLHEGIEPIIFFFNPNWYDHYLMRIQPGNFTTTIDALGETWAQFYPDWPFEFHFADQGFDAQYRAEESLGQIFTTFAILAIVIACLGLFGLASFTAQQRTKEIGVRKVLGASVGSLVVLLSKEFTILVLVAFVVAVPLAYVAMDRWLQDFAYRVEISWPIFLVAGLSALVIAWLTVSYQSIKSALTNPVESLRYE